MVLRVKDDGTTELILACARPRADADPDDVARLAASVTNWGAVCGVASMHSLLPLLAVRMGESGLTIPPEVATAASVAAAHNLSLVSSLLRVRGLLAAEGIDTIAFKGPALSVTLYDDPALRQSTDLDLLVRRHQALPARRLLEAAGSRFWLNLTEGQEARFLRYSNEYGLRDPGGGIVELSWALMPGQLALDLDADRFFADASSVELGGAPVTVLAPHDQLLALAAHGGKHLWERLGWITDIAQLLATNPDLDVSRAIARARSVGAERLLLVGPALSRLLLGSDLPSALSVAIDRDPAVARLTARLADRLTPLRIPRDHRVFDPLLLDLRERANDRVRILTRLALTSTVEDWQWVRLPDALAFAYPAVRPFRLAKKYLFS
jgi:hypothetical protein